MEKTYDMLREQTPHGNAMFPLMVHRITTDSSFTERVCCHWHKELELLLVTKGRAQVYIDDRSYRVEEGNLIFVLSNHLHSITAEEGESFDFYAVVFDQTLLNSFVKDAIQQQYLDSVKEGRVIFPECIAPRMEWEVRVAELLLEICQVFEEKREAYELCIKAKLYEIWCLLYTHAGKQALPESGNTEERILLIKAVMEYMKEHYDEHISLSALAERFGVSEGHLCRLFKAVTNLSVVEYLNYYRISMSTGLLRETTRDIGEIAGMTGFNNISYYNKVFKRYMNMTPSEFRRGM